MNDDDKLIYQDLYNKIVHGMKPEIVIENKEIETKINEEIDLYSLINASDLEDGILDKSNIEIETDLNLNKLGTYEVKYIVTDSDKNISSDTINIKVVAHEYDLSKLEELIEKVKKINPDDYIAESYENLQNELNKSKDMLLREDLTQDIVDNQIKILQNTIDNLQLLKKYTVTFETNGANQIEKIFDIMENSKISNPENPIKEGFNFAGWYKDENYNEMWDFETDIVNKDTVLYAKWIKSEKTEIPQTDVGNTGEAEKLEKPQADTRNTVEVENPGVPETDGNNTREIENREVSPTYNGNDRKTANVEVQIITDGNTEETEKTKLPSTLNKNEDIQNVKTGDYFNFGGWFFALVLSGTILVVLTRKITYRNIK